MRRWAPFCLLTALPALTALTACGTSTTAAPRTTTTHPAVVSDYAIADDQYRRIQIGLKLPPGVTYPAHLPNTSDHYPQGSGGVAAQNYWLCAWLGAFLGKDRQALGHLPQYVRMDAYSKALDARGRSTVNAVISDARKGRTPRVVTFTHNTCGGPFYGKAARPS